MKSNKAYRELGYPLGELLIALPTLRPAPEYSPLFLRLISLANRLIEATGVFLPLYSRFKSLLSSKGLFSKLPAKKGRAFEFDLNIRLTKEHMRDTSFWDDFLRKTLNQLIEYSSFYVDNPGFDSFSFKVVRLLKSVYKSRLSIERKLIVKKTVG